jgi:hypothetical protein
MQDSSSSGSPSSQTQRFWRYLLMALPLFVSVLLYGYTVRLPFFLDDGLLLTMIRDYPSQGVPGLRFWGGAPLFPYYRPLVFSVWEVDYGLLNGHFDPFTLHLLNVVLFGLTGCALARMTQRLTQRPLAGWIAGLAFVLFPFSYNAVIWVASMFHVMMALFLILALWLAILWLDHRGGAVSLVLCWLFTFACVFSHESGVVLLPLAGLLILIRYGFKSLWQARVWLLAAPMIAITAAYFYLSFTVPHPTNPIQLLFPMLLDSLALMLQGLVYPIAALIRQITQTTANTLGLLALTIIVIVPILYLLARYSRKFALLAGFGVAWYILGALPSALLLPTDYIQGSPRLLLLTSLGASLFWGVALSTLLPHSISEITEFSMNRKLATALAGVFVVVGVIASLTYLGTRQMEALIQSDYAWRLMSLVRGRGGTPMIINAPSWLAAQDQHRTFPAMSEGVMFVANYMNYGLIFWAQTGESFPLVQAMVYPPTLNPSPDVSYAPYQSDSPESDFTTRLVEATDIYVTEFDGRSITPVYVGSPGMAGPDTAIATFPDGGVSLTQAEARLGGSQQVKVKTRWQVINPSHVAPVVRVLCDGEVIGESQLPVWGGTHPFWAWKAGETQTDFRTIPLSRAVAEQCLRVYVGIVKEDDSTLMAVIDANTKQLYPDNLVPVMVSASVQ